MIMRNNVQSSKAASAPIMTATSGRLVKRFSLAAYPAKLIRIKAQDTGKIGNQVLKPDDTTLANIAKPLVLAVELTPTRQARTALIGMPTVKYIQKNRTWCSFQSIVQSTPENVIRPTDTVA